MNLIEISEQLKDVPDQFLMKEVKTPSGTYPSYLVVAELGRRKRMRESVMKEKPETTVAEDLVRPSREEMMAAMAKMQQAQQVAQPMSPAAPRLNAGLMATPQAGQELAAQDAMAAMPQRQPVGMAAGGMVAFKHGGNVDSNGVIRAFDGLPEYMYDPTQGRSSVRGIFPFIGSIFEPTQEPIGAEERRLKELALREAAMRQREDSRDQAMSAILSRQGQAPAGGAGGAGGVPNVRVPVLQDPYQTQMATNLTAMQALREPTEQEVSASRRRAVEEYERMIPDRATPLLESEIARQEKGLSGRRESNINEALIQAGLGIMGSKSPRFLQAAGEAGTAALRDYRQGMKDIREGERDLMKSRVDLANAQTLRDQNKMGAADKAEQRGLDAYKRGMDRLNTESAIIARNQSASYQQYQGQLAGIKLPYEIGELQARAQALTARGTTLSDADQKAAEESARQRAMMTPNIKFGTPEYQNLYNRYYQEELQRRAAGINYQPPAQQQLNRGTL